MLGLPWWLRWYRIRLQCRRPVFNPWVGKIPRRREWQPISAFLPGESHGQRRRVDYSLWCHKESEMTEQLTHVWMMLRKKLCIFILDFCKAPGIMICISVWKPWNCKGVMETKTGQRGWAVTIVTTHPWSHILDPQILESLKASRFS